MSRCIDADLYAAELWKLRENYQMLDDTHTADKIMHGIFRAEQALKEQPTVDAVPVVHGEWIECDDLESAMKGKVVCSNCKEPQQSIEISNEYIRFKNQKTRYCPNCGARMDGENDAID